MLHCHMTCVLCLCNSKLHCIVGYSLMHILAKVEGHLCNPGIKEICHNIYTAEIAQVVS